MWWAVDREEVDRLRKRFMKLDKVRQSEMSRDFWFHAECRKMLIRRFADAG